MVFAHLVEIRKPQGQDDFGVGTIFRGQFTDEYFPDVAPPEIESIPKGRYQNLAAVFRNGCRLPNGYRYGVDQSGGRAFKLEGCPACRHGAVTRLENVDAFVAERVVYNDVFFNDRFAVFDNGQPGSKLFRCTGIIKLNIEIITSDAETQRLDLSVETESNGIDCLAFGYIDKSLKTEQGSDNAADQQD